MTVIVGLLCRDGIVVASDSQESDDELGMKRLDVVKVYDTERFHFEDVEIVVAGTGSSAYIARAAELIEEKGFAPHFTTPRTVAHVVEDSLGEMKQRYGSGLDLEMLVGVFCRNCPQTDSPPLAPIGLFSVGSPAEGENVGVAEPVADYSALGSGGLFARYLLNRLHDESNRTTNLDMNAAIREAVYVIEEVKKVDLWCGGPTQVHYIQKSRRGYRLRRKKPNEVREIVQELARADAGAKERQRQMLVNKKSL